LTVVGSELNYANRPENISTLEQIAASRMEIWHVGALQGLRHIRDIRVAPAFIHALDDLDRSAQYQGVIGLAQLFDKGPDWGPGMGPFNEDPAKYIHNWKEWWVSHEDLVPK
jgi:hypothetical protein